MADRRLGALSRLGQTLRELPRERAGADFTARVLARLDEPPPRRRLPLAAIGVAAAAALGLALVAGPLRTGGERAESRREAAAEARRLLEELQREHRALASELDALAAEPPVIYLGGDEEVDLVLDLSRVPAAAPPEVRGASLAGDRRP